MSKAEKKQDKKLRKAILQDVQKIEKAVDVTVEEAEEIQEDGRIYVSQGEYEWSEYQSNTENGSGFVESIPVVGGSSTEEGKYNDLEKDEIREKFIETAFETSLETFEMEEFLENNTINRLDEIDDDKFFNKSSITTIYDLEREVPNKDKNDLNEIDRYWVNEPYAFISLLKSESKNEIKYFVIEPGLTEREEEVRDIIVDKIQDNLRHSEDSNMTDKEKCSDIEENYFSLLDRYGFIDDELDNIEPYDGGIYRGVKQIPDVEKDVRREEDVLGEEEISMLSIFKILYYNKRRFVGFKKLDPIMKDINIEDISANGYDLEVFVYHTELEQIISNLVYTKEEIDDYVIELAQRSGKGISKRNPVVDTTLPNGYRANLVLGEEVSDRGTNFTIRQFKDIPFTPVDLINWKTFSLDQIAMIWLSIENDKSIIVAGGTASGKTTSLNAFTFFIPSNRKIVSIEDTRELELLQQNWIASVTRPSFTEGEKGAVDEFDLLESALRQRPDYIAMGEIRGEEGRTLFQVMSTGHPTVATFHADDASEVVKRFTSEPINVPKTMFSALDLITIQQQTRIDGHKVRRNDLISQVKKYDEETGSLQIQDLYKWDANTDEQIDVKTESLYEEIMFDRGWDQERLQEELFKRKLVLAYMIKNDINTFAGVGATLQSFMVDQDSVLALMKQGELKESIDSLREMETIEIDVDPEKEEMTPRPSSPDDILELSESILDEAEERVFDDITDERVDISNISSEDFDDPIEEKQTTDLLEKVDRDIDLDE